MFIEIKDGLIINADNINGLEVDWQWSGVTNSRYGLYYIYVGSTRFNITKNDYDKLKSILIHGVVDRKLTIWQKIKIFALHWLQSIKSIIPSRKK